MSGGDGYYSGLYSINMYPLCQEETDTIADYTLINMYPLCQEETDTIADYTLLIFILYVRRRQIL